MDCYRGMFTDFFMSMDVYAVASRPLYNIRWQTVLFRYILAVSMIL